MSTLLRQLGLGRLAYRVVHAPLAAARRSVAAGGPIEQWRTARGRAAMARAALELPPPGGDPTKPPLCLHVLTGRRFWDQTAFCLWSFARQAGRVLAPRIHDDGTLEPKQAEVLRQLFPAAELISAAHARAQLEERLPRSRFPVLRDRWDHYPQIRKLIDPHLGSHGWKLVIDSDLLFFRAPEFIVRWLEHPDRPLHAVDAETSYGYSPALLTTMAGRPLAELLNVGLCGLNSDELDWEHLERLCGTLIAREGTHYFLEQALVAILAAGRDCAVAPAADYVTLPVPPEAHECRAAMHHYVAGAKRWYYRHCWRVARARGTAT